MQARHIILRRRPEGLPSLDDLAIEDRAVPAPEDGQVQVRPLVLSIDPYMVMLMRGSGVYDPLPPGQPMRGRAVAEVVQSRAPGFEPGDVVLDFMSWAELVNVPAASLIRLDPDRVELGAYLGAAGHSGMTAWVGICHTAQVKAGETVLVSAASGAVGSAAGQIARLRGATRVVGIAGGADKVRHVVEEMGFDACIDHRAPDWLAQLQRAVPDGVDVLFENVGGKLFDGALTVMKPRGRIALCGMVAGYDETEPLVLHHMQQFLQRSLTMTAFSIYHHAAQRAAIVDELAGWVREGRLKYAQTTVHGIEQAPAALMSLLAGNKVGKQLVQVAERSR